MLYENLDGTGRRFETNTSLLIQGGDISSERRDGSSRGESIYGESFADESFEQMHSEPGLLSIPTRTLTLTQIRARTLT